jgi:hypothetical protein
MTDPLPEDEHKHPSPAHKAACPVCNPGKTVPELNEAYRQETRYQQIMQEWAVGRLAP